MAQCKLRPNLCQMKVQGKIFKLMPGDLYVDSLRLNDPTYFLPRISLIFYMMKIWVFPLHNKEKKVCHQATFCRIKL